MVERTFSAPMYGSQGRGSRTTQRVPPLPSPLAAFFGGPLAFLGEKTVITAVGYTDVVACWYRGRAVWRRRFPPTGSTCIAVSPDDRLIAVGTGEGRLLVLEARSGRTEVDRLIGGEGVISLGFAPDSNQLAVGRRDSLIDIMKIGAPSVRQLTWPLWPPITGLKFLPGTGLLTVADGEGLVVGNLRSGEVVRSEHDVAPTESPGFSCD